jgi:hypothetical protein
MSTKSSNRSGSLDQGAFGDQKKQATEGQNETKYDKDSKLKLPGEKDLPYTGENQAAKSPIKEAGRHRHKDKD